MQLHGSISCKRVVQFDAIFHLTQKHILLKLERIWPGEYISSFIEDKKNIKKRVSEDLQALCSDLLIIQYTSSEWKERGEDLFKEPDGTEPKKIYLLGGSRAVRGSEALSGTGVEIFTNPILHNLLHVRINEKKYDSDLFQIHFAYLNNFFTISISEEDLPLSFIISSSPGANHQAAIKYYEKVMKRLLVVVIPDSDFKWLVEDKILIVKCNENREIELKESDNFYRKNFNLETLPDSTTCSFEVSKSYAESLFAKIEQEEVYLYPIEILDKEKALQAVRHIINEYNDSERYVERLLDYEKAGEIRFIRDGEQRLRPPIFLSYRKSLIYFT